MWDGPPRDKTQDVSINNDGFIQIPVSQLKMENSYTLNSKKVGTLCKIKRKQECKKCANLIKVSHGLFIIFIEKIYLLKVRKSTVHIHLGI